MSFPQRIRAALAKTDCSTLPGDLALDEECSGAKFHSPSPLILHETSTSNDGETVLLCGTCCANLEVLQHLLAENDGDLPWNVRREFGNLIRAIGLKGWQADNEDEVASV